LTLTARLSWFFLATLALVLVGFSTALYLVARQHLHRQAEERLDAALNTIVAAAEIIPDGVEWEPGQRYMNLAATTDGAAIAWLVTDDQGQPVDRSQQSESEPFLVAASKRLRSEGQSAHRLDWQGEHWLCGQREIEPATGSPENAVPRRSTTVADGRTVAARLQITAALSLEPVRATLRQLAGVMAGLSVAVWLVALFGWRLVCRRALAPVTRMAVAAREMSVDDLGHRLPVSANGDELEDLSRAFNNLLDRLQESFQRQKRFTGDASHQLRTPLTAMIGQIEVALRRDRSDEEYRRVLNAVHHNAEHMRQIVESLLFLARANSEASQPERERVDLQDWLPAHLQTWTEHSRAKDIALERDSGEPEPVDVQPVLLGELVNILIDNACKFSPRGSPINVRLCRESGSVCIHVQDQGPGVGAAEIPYLFTPFFRSADAREQGIDGTGLGLSIAKRLAETFGGTLTVTSKPGDGSCFTLHLPTSVPFNSPRADLTPALKS
jgi:heavy metal sensor kinase